MKTVEFKLVSGARITLFLGTGNLVIVENTKPGASNSTTICDGIHNNGGWVVVGTYKEVVAKLAGV